MTAASSHNSPDALQLRKKPMIGPRLGRRAAVVVGAIAACMVALLIYNTEARKKMNEDKPRQAASEADTRLAPAVSGAEAFTKGVSDELKASTTPAYTSEPALQMATPPGMPLAGSVPPAGVTQTVPDLSTASGMAPQLDIPEAERRLAEEMARLESEAVKAPTAVNTWKGAGSGGSESMAVAGGALAPASPAAQVPGLADLDFMSKQLAGLQGQAGGQQQPQDQAKKKEFLASTQQLEAPYLAAQRQAPRSAFEMKTGTVIPAVMISGINSDLPGEVSAVVADNVYDTASGRHLLIPAWTKVFGKYDSEVAYGQKRALVVWTRLIFPDGSTLELGGMQGMDVAGYSGFRDKVDNHYGRLIGFSALSSVMSAGMQLSQPREDNTNGQPSNRQIVAGEAGRELSQLGVELTRRNLNVQPTIRIRNGYRFTILVNRDVAFAAPYVTK